MVRIISESQRFRLLENGRQSLKTTKLIDHRPVVKLIVPGTKVVWLISEISPADQDRAFGLFDLLQGPPEIGEFTFTELKRINDNILFGIELDTNFIPMRKLSEYAIEALRNNRID